MLLSVAVSTHKSTIAGRSQRDELEQLQEDLRDVRHQLEVLPQENAGLAQRLSQQKEELRALEQARDAARAEWNKPLSSLPEQLVTPFIATPSQRSLQGRLFYAVRRLPQLMPLFMVLFLYKSFFFGNKVPQGRLSLALALGAAVVWFLAHLVSTPKHDDEDERRVWSFDEEGFGLTAVGSRKVLYSEVRQVDAIQGWLKRGTLRVTWAPQTTTRLGQVTEGSEQVLEIPLIDAPARLAEWLLARSRAAREKTGGTRGG